MKIYLAGKWEERKRIKDIADAVRLHGHTISFPWFEQHSDSTPLQQSSIDDVCGVRDARVCIFIFEKVLPYNGALSELGMAIAFDKDILLVGHAVDNNIFTHYPSVQRVEVVEEIIPWLEAL